MKSFNGLNQLIFILGLAGMVAGSVALFIGYEGAGARFFTYGFWILLGGTSLYVVGLFRRH